MSNDVTRFHKEERSDIETFFSKISDLLSEFAGKHNLKVDKYWHEFPSWRFSFKHPRGGVACIEIMKEGEKELRVYGYWWFDDYDEGTRSSRKYESKIFHIDEVHIPNLLDDTLKQIVSWPLNSWTEVGTGFKSYWSKTFSKEQFTSLSDKYPALKF